MVDADTGAVAERYMYDPYGKVTILNGAYGADDDVDNETVFEWDEDDDRLSDVANDILYCGYRNDPQTGLFHVRNRYHDPFLGRFISRDPTGYQDGMSLYEYVGSGPTHRGDPYGRDCEFRTEVDVIDLLAPVFEEPEAVKNVIVEGSGWMLASSFKFAALVTREIAKRADHPVADVVAYAQQKAVDTVTGVAVVQEVEQAGQNAVKVVKESPGKLTDPTLYLRAYIELMEPSPMFGIYGPLAPYFGLSGSQQLASADSEVEPANRRTINLIKDTYTAAYLAYMGIKAITRRAPVRTPTKGMGGRPLSAAEKAQFDAFAARARAQGLTENPYRTGSWGKMENGKFVEKVRIDVGEVGKPAFRGETHIHVEGQGSHLDPSTKIPGEQ